MTPTAFAGALLLVGIGVDDVRIAATERPLDVEAMILGHFIRTLQLTVPTEQLTSGDKGLDTNMRNALKHKDIVFQMDSYDVLATSAVGVTLADLPDQATELAAAGMPTGSTVVRQTVIEARLMMQAQF